MSDSLIPSSKFDDAAVERLRQSEPAQIAAVAFAVLTWIQDPNWPISCEVESIMSLHVNTVKDGLLQVLRGEDAEWKYRCLTSVILPATVPQLDEDLLTELRRLAAKPTPSEQAEDVPEYAREALDRWDQPQKGRKH